MDVVDFQTDCYDDASHLNPSGARKVTDYLGAYLTAHYDLPDRRGDALYAGWNGDYADYLDFEQEKLREQNDLYVYLMLLANRHFDIFMELSDETLLEDEKAVLLLANMGVDMATLSGEDDAGKQRFFIHDGHAARQISGAMSQHVNEILGAPAAEPGLHIVVCAAGSWRSPLDDATFHYSLEEGDAPAPTLMVSDAYHR